MRILYLSPGLFDKGGIARYGRYQVQALQESVGPAEIWVSSLAGRTVGDLESPFHADFAGAVPVSRASRAHFVAAAAGTALRCKPRVVLTAHVHLGPLGLALARLVGAALVQNVYGLELWPAGGLAAHRRWALRASDGIISDCHATAAFVQAHDMARRPPSVVWDCVDASRFVPGRVAWRRLGAYGLHQGGRFRLLFLGRLAERARHKGFERMLRLLASLPADRFEGVVAGQGDKLDSLRALATELGIADRVCFTGAIAEADLPAMYRSADALYLASELGDGMGEGIPLVPMEAMACGVPVIVGNQDGSAELLDGDGGWCGDPHDLEGQAAYLHRLAAEPDLRAHEQKAARHRVEATFSYQRFRAETAAALKEVAA